MFYLFFFETMHRNGYIIISFHQKEEKKIYPWGFWEELGMGKEEGGKGDTQ